MRERPSSRLLVIDPLNRILLFRFEHKHGALAGQRFWATPGGALDPGETYAQAASRELREETGLVMDDPGPELARRFATFQLPDGETVCADERFFLVRVQVPPISTAGWTDSERQVIGAHYWWSAAELVSTTEQVWPDDLADLLARLGVWRQEQFGDTPELQDVLAKLIAQGVKRATTSLARWYDGPEPLAMPRRREVYAVLDGAGCAICWVRTISVKQCRFSDVDAVHARWEGEGDGSLAHWRSIHRTFFERETRRCGFAFDDTSMVVLERFKLCRVSTLPGCRTRG